MKKKLLTLLLAIFFITSMVHFKDSKAMSGSQFSKWWSPDWNYRIKVRVYSGGFARDDEPVELTIDFASLFSRWGISGTLDTDSIRVIDQSDSPKEVLSQFDPTSGEIIWLTGEMDAESSKTYYVYFDILENGPKSSPSYFSSMENGGILVLPMSDHISVMYKIGGVEYEIARIDETNGRICYFRPPFGSPLIEDTASRLGSQMEGGTFRGGAVSITGGPVRYNIEFHYEPRNPDVSDVFSDYYYTFYYVPNGDEIKTKLNVTWTGFQNFSPQIPRGKWPTAFEMQEENVGSLHTAFLASDIDSATLYDIPSTWGPIDGDAIVSPGLSDNFWGAYGEYGGVGIIPISPDYSNWCVDGYRDRNGWNWSAAEKSIVDFIDRGTYNWDIWIYGYDQDGWDSAKDFGNRVEEPITIETSFDQSLTIDPGPDQPAKIITPVNRGAPSFYDREDEEENNKESRKIAWDNFNRGDHGKHKFSVAWLGPDWTYRKRLTFNNSSQSENLINFPVLVKLTPGNFDYSHCESDGRDIRFVDADDTTELEYHFEDWNYNGDSYIWVKVPQIDGSSSTDYIWMYYGNSGAIDDQDEANVWDANFVGVWHLNEGGTGTRYDSTSNNNDGTPQNYDGDEAITGKIGGADDFDGSNDLIRVPDSASLDGTNDAGTFELWINWVEKARGTDNQLIMASSNRFQVDAYDGFEWSCSRTPDIFFYPWGGTNFNYNLGPNPAINGQWHHVVVTLKNTVVREVKIYVDTVSIEFTVENVPTYWTTLASPADWLWGGNPDRTGRYFGGKMDEIRVSDVVRSTAWIRAQFLSMSDNFITFGPEAAADKIGIEDAADGTGAEIDIKTITSGESFTAYAISRDASDNFVDNVAVDWSLTGKTEGVVDSDLVPSGDTKSATFTGYVAGTARIKASHSTLGDDTTGIISVTSGTADKIRIEDAADGTGAEVDTRAIASGQSFTVYAISRDASDNFVENVAVSWSLIDLTGGVVSGDLVAAGDNRSAVFTGNSAGTARINAQHGTLGNDATGIITVSAGTGTRVVIEDAADGTGAEVDTRAIASGQSFTVYAISRDASDNFVENVAVSWSLIDLTGGVVSGDLVAAGDNRSAIFTSHASGTARIKASHATLGDDTTGLITVTNQPPVALFEYEPKTGFAPLEISFDASASYDPDGHIVSYEWDFGDGSMGSGVKTSHTYTSKGEFLVTLKVTDNDGLTDTATAQIKVQAVYPPINVSLRREINRSFFRQEAFHTITWSSNPATSGLTIINYRIYRKEAGEGDGSYQLIGTVSGSTFEYVDGYLDVTNNFVYVITSVESSGHQSEFSFSVGN